ncbi:MauE/DoxX family redox-associated membrane protein [Myxococcota bacterium]
MKSWISWRGHRWLGFPARLYLGWVFLIACVHKILHPGSFAVDVATYQFLPLSTVNLFALTVPWMELGAGALLVLGIRVRAAALVVSGLMVSFMIALAWALHLGLDMSCGCFASQAAAENDPISWHTLGRDAGWLLLGLYVLFFDHHPIGLETLKRRQDRCVT